MTLREQLEEQILCYWASHLKEGVPDSEFLQETDFLPENRPLFRLLSETKAKSTEEILTDLYRLGRHDTVELLKRIAQTQNLTEFFVEKSISEWQNIGNFESIKTVVNKTIAEMESVCDAFTLAYSLGEIGKKYVEGYSKSNSRETQKYKSLKWLNNLDKPAETFKFPAFPFMNDLGVERGHLIVISGLFKSGKTTAALALAFEQEAQGEKFGYISAEMKEDNIHQIFYSYKFDISSSVWKKRTLHPHDKKMISDYIGSGADLYRFDIETHLTIERLKVLIERHARLGIKFIVVDYYQRILIENSHYRTREEELTYISNKLVEFAKEYDVCLVIISQMNRGAFTSATTGNMAGSLALNRDADFLFNMLKPTDNPNNKGTNQMKIDNEIVMFDKHDFLLELERSRHTRGGATALLTRERTGRLTVKWENFTKALDYDYDNTYKVNLTDYSRTDEAF